MLKVGRSLFPDKTFPMITPSRHQQAFSIIELSVAMALVVVLAILSTMGISSVRGKARTVQCLNHVRQLANGVILYNQENRGFYPPHLGQYSTQEGRYTLIWYGHIAQYVTNWNLSIASPMGKTFYCPANKVADPNSSASYLSTSDPATCRNYSYGYNYGQLSSMAGYAAVRSTAILNPSKLVILSEIPNFQTPSDVYTFPLSGDAVKTNLKQYPGDRQISLRHGGMANFAFADGHVETHPVKEFIGSKFNIGNWVPELSK